MTIKILIGDKGNVDFGSYIIMANEEYQKFLQMMRSLFAVVKEVKVNDLRNWRLADDDRVQYPRIWAAEEYEVLLKSRTVDEAVDKLGRSGMSIVAQMAKWWPAFVSWCYEKGKNPLSGDLLQIIKEFMREKKDELLSRRNKKKEIKQKEDKIEELSEELNELNSEKKRKIVELLSISGKLKTQSVDDFINKKKEELVNEIKSIKDTIAKLKRN